MVRRGREVKIIGGPLCGSTGRRWSDPVHVENWPFLVPSEEQQEYAYVQETSDTYRFGEYAWEALDV